MKSSFFVNDLKKNISVLSNEEIAEVGGAHPGGEENHEITRTEKEIKVDAKKPSSQVFLG